MFPHPALRMTRSSDSSYMHKTIRHITAFTLIELLVVISIIGILAALLLANFAGIRDRANDAKLKNNLKQFQTAMRLAYNDSQSYPDDPADVSAFVSGYMDAVPTLSAYYDGGDTFKACIDLANKADKEAAESQTRCGVTPTTAGRFCVCNK